MIAGLLHVRDVAAARGASRAFVSEFYDQQFWRTRFEARGERARLFEATRGTGGGKGLDWRALYNRKCGKRLSLQELNRARIWPIIEDSRDVLSLEWSGPAPWPPGMVLTGDHGSTAGQHWLTVCGDILDTLMAEYHGGGRSFCFPFQEQAIHLPGAIKAISASTVWLEDMTYVTGMNVTPVGHRSIRLGYRNPQGELYLDVADGRGFTLRGLIWPWADGLSRLPRASSLTRIRRAGLVVQKMCRCVASRHRTAFPVL